MMEAGFIHDVSLEQKNDRDRISIENPSFHELMAVVPSDATFEPLELASRSFVKLESGGGCICICVCGGWMKMPGGTAASFIARLMITIAATACSRGPNSLPLV